MLRIITEGGHWPLPLCGTDVQWYKVTSALFYIPFRHIQRLLIVCLPAPLFPLDWIAQDTSIC